MSALERGVDGDRLQLRLESVEATHLLVGDDAMKAAARLLPTVNRFGGSRAQVQEAVSVLEEIGDPARVLTTLQQRFGATAGEKRWEAARGAIYVALERRVVQKLPGALHTLAPRDRLALEMALHEESERRAMDGELAALELAWAEAEQIAKIADDMFLPASIDDRLDKLRER
jgi:hypothetical protein